MCLVLIVTVSVLSPASTVWVMKTLVICRPRPGVLPADIARHAPAEMAGLAALKADGLLVEAYSPGGPGAILVFQASRPEAEDALAALPLVAAELIEAEIIELHPFPGLSS